MSAHRFLFYVPELTDGDTRAVISGEECHHLSRVLRAAVGDDVFVTNGRGLLVSAKIESIDAGRCNACVESVVHTDPPRQRVTLALALLRKGAFERALEMCVEAGITECVPFVAARSHVKSYSTAFVERLRRVALSAMKQSFRSFLPAVSAPATLDEIVARCRNASAALVGDPGGAAMPAPPFAGEVVVVVGPEAGLGDDERGALEDAGAVPVSVSPYRLRAETAALVIVSRAVPPSD